MKTLRDRLESDTLQAMPFPYVELPEDNVHGVEAGRYVSVDAFGAAASEWNSDDLRVVWEVVSSWSIGDEAAAYLAGWDYPESGS